MHLYNNIAVNQSIKCLELINCIFKCVGYEYHFDGNRENFLHIQNKIHLNDNINGYT